MSKLREPKDPKLGNMWSALYRFQGKCWMQDVWEAGDARGCWLWLDAPNPNGYPSFWDGRTQWSGTAHRYSYLMFVGELIEGLEIDHMCNTPMCVNPEHLEQKTGRENSTRAARRHDSCARGHLWTEENTLWRKGSAGLPTRRCRECMELGAEKKALRDAAWREAQREARNRLTPTGLVL